MRIKPGTALIDTYSALTPRQQARVDLAVQAQAKKADALKAVTNRPYEAVRRALEAGIPVRILADALNVSPARVYQMRDLAREYRAAKN